MRKQNIKLIVAVDMKLSPFGNLDYAEKSQQETQEF